MFDNQANTKQGRDTVVLHEDGGDLVTRMRVNGAGFTGYPISQTFAEAVNRLGVQAELDHEAADRLFNVRETDGANAVIDEYRELDLGERVYVIRQLGLMAVNPLQLP